MLTDPIPGFDVGHPAWSPDGDSIAFDMYLESDLTDEPEVQIWVAQADGSDTHLLVSCEAPCLQLAYPAWSPDESMIALARYDLDPDGTWGPSEIQILDVATGELSTVAATADGLSAYYAPRWSPDGEQLVFVVEKYPDATQTSRTESYIAVAPVSGIGLDEPQRLTPAMTYSRTPRIGLRAIPSCSPRQPQKPISSAQPKSARPASTGRI